MMAQFLPLNIVRQKSHSNRLFKASIFDIPLRFSEDYQRELNFLIDLSSDCKTERTILDFLTALGMPLQMNGTEYMLCIITNVVNSLYLPKRTTDFYQIAADKYKQKKKIIEVAVIRAVASIKLSRIQRANYIFGCEVIEKDNLSAGAFLSAVCGRFIMLKSHEKGKLFFA